MAVKPTVIIVVGAWHHPEHYKPLSAGLEKEGYPSKIIDLPSVGAEPPHKAFEEDVLAVRNALSSTLKKGKDVILFAHSYGGVPASQAMEGLDGLGEAASGTGRILKMIFCCGFALPEGQCPMDPLGGQCPPWMDIEGEYCRAKTPADTFYNDVKEEVQKEAVAALSKYHSYPTFLTVLRYAGWKHVPHMYFFTKLDATLPYEFQVAIVENAGGKFETETLNAGHSPFLSVPNEVVSAIRRAAGEEI